MYIEEFKREVYEVCKKCKTKRNIALMPKCMICVYDEVKTIVHKRNLKPKKEAVDYTDAGRPLFEFICNCGEKYLSTGHIKACESCRFESKLKKKK